MSRIGGYGLTLPFQSPATGDTPGTLQSGGIYRIPAGNWLWMAGQQIGLQWYDPTQGAWRSIGSPGSLFDWISSDGNNFRLINLSGVVTGASITNAGSAGTNGIGPTATGCTISFAGPATAASGNTATGYAIVGGSVQAPTITQAGSGFTAAPLVLIDAPPPGGIQATATATVSSTGTITAITMQNVGAGYTASPNFYLVPSGPATMNPLPVGFVSDPFPFTGLIYPTNLPALPIYQNNYSLTGCQLTSAALTGSGTLTGIVMVNNGGGYDGTHIPAITISGVTSAAATAVMSMACTSVTVGTAGVAYGTSAMWETSLGMVVPGQMNNQMPNAKPARGVCALTGGAVTSFTIEDPGFGFQKVPQVAVLGTNTIPTTYATGTVVCGGVVDTYILQGKVQ